MSDLPQPPNEGDEKVKEKFFHPETGEEMSKNAWKKLQKGPGKVKKGEGAKPNKRWWWREEGEEGQEEKSGGTHRRG